MSKIKHLIFDCDGVLVDTEYVAAIKMTAMLHSLGIEITLDHYLKNLSGSTFSAILDIYFAHTLTPEDANTIINKVEDEVAAEVQIIAGIDQLLPTISTPKSVVSNSSVRTVQDALIRTGIYAFFESRIFSSEQVSRPKPAPDIYLKAIATLGLNTDEILVVEDSITGAKAARAAGLSVIGFLGGSHILAGHAERLTQIGVVQIAQDARALATILNEHLPL